MMLCKERWIERKRERESGVVLLMLLPENNEPIDHNHADFRNHSGRVVRMRLNAGVLQESKMCPSQFSLPLFIALYATMIWGISYTVSKNR